MQQITVPDTFQGDRRENCADKRGVPAAYARAMSAFKQPCVHCDQKAVYVNGEGVGLCAHHRDAPPVDDGLRQLREAKRRIAMMKAEL